MFVVSTLFGNNTFTEREYLVKASTTITRGDLVKIAAGYIDLADTGDKIFGVAGNTVVQGASATKKVLVRIAHGLVVRATNDNTGTTFALAHVGTYFDIAGATGAQVIDTSTTTATKGQLLCVAFNPTGRDATEGDFIVAESMLDAYAQVA